MVFDNNKLVLIFRVNWASFNVAKLVITTKRRVKKKTNKVEFKFNFFMFFFSLLNYIIIATFLVNQLLNIGDSCCIKSIISYKI